MLKFSHVVRCIVWISCFVCLSMADLQPTPAGRESVSGAPMAVHRSSPARCQWTFEVEEGLPKGDKRGRELFFPRDSNCTNCSLSKPCCYHIYGRRVLFWAEGNGPARRVRSDSAPLIVPKSLGNHSETCSADYELGRSGVFVRRDNDRVMRLNSPSCTWVDIGTQGWHEFPILCAGSEARFSVIGSSGVCFESQISVSNDACQKISWFRALMAGRCWVRSHYFLVFALSVLLSLAALRVILRICQTISLLFDNASRLCCNCTWVYYLTQGYKRKKSPKRAMVGPRHSRQHGNSASYSSQSMSDDETPWPDSDSEGDDQELKSSCTQVVPKVTEVVVTCFSLLLTFPVLCVEGASCVRPVTVTGTQMSCVSNLDLVQCSAEFSAFGRIPVIGGSYCATVDYGSYAEQFSIGLIDVSDVYRLEFQYLTGTWFPYLTSSSRCSGTSGCDYSSCSYAIQWGSRQACLEADLQNKSRLLCQSECKSVDCVGDCFSARCCTSVWAFPVSEPAVSVYKLIREKRSVTLDVNGSLVTYDSGLIRVGDFSVSITDTGGPAIDLPFEYVCIDKQLAYLCDASAARKPVKDVVGDVQFDSSGIMQHMASNLVAYYWKGKRPVLSNNNHPGWEVGRKEKLPYRIPRGTFTRLDAQSFVFRYETLDSSVEFSMITDEDYTISYYTQPVIPKIEKVRAEGYKDSASGPLICISAKSTTSGGSCKATVDNRNSQIALDSTSRDYCFEANSSLISHQVCLDCSFGESCSTLKHKYELLDIVNNSTNTSGTNGFLGVATLTKVSGSVLLTVVSLVIICLVALVAIQIVKRILSKEKNN